MKKISKIIEPVTYKDVTWKVVQALGLNYSDSFCLLGETDAAIIFGKYHLYDLPKWCAQNGYTLYMCVGTAQYLILGKGFKTGFVRV